MLTSSSQVVALWWVNSKRPTWPESGCPIRSCGGIPQKWFQTSALCTGIKRLLLRKNVDMIKAIINTTCNHSNNEINSAFPPNANMLYFHQPKQESALVSALGFSAYWAEDVITRHCRPAKVGSAYRDSSGIPRDCQLRSWESMHKYAHNTFYTEVKINCRPCFLISWIEVAFLFSSFFGCVVHGAEIAGEIQWMMQCKRRIISLVQHKPAHQVERSPSDSTFTIWHCHITQPIKGNGTVKINKILLGKVRHLDDVL